MSETTLAVFMAYATGLIAGAFISAIIWRVIARRLLRDNDRLRADLARITRKTLADRQARSAASRLGWERRRRQQAKGGKMLCKDCADERLLLYEWVTSEGIASAECEDCHATVRCALVHAKNGGE
jgi:hypothetical protein